MKMSILVSARKNSMFLSQFLLSYFNKTNFQSDYEVLVMMNKFDSYNNDLVSYWKDIVSFRTEDYKLGRPGLHVYFNELAKEAKGDWVIYFCDDHSISTHGWDKILLDWLKPYDPEKIFGFSPRYNNTGSVNHVLSRGYLKALGYLGRHGNIDSYINELFDEIPNSRTITPFGKDQALFHDYTANEEVISPEHVKPLEKLLPDWDSDEVNSLIVQDAQTLRQAIAKGM